MCGELWLTKSEYEILGYPPRSKLKKGKVVSEKKHGKTGPFASTVGKRGNTPHTEDTPHRRTVVPL